MLLQRLTLDRENGRAACGNRSGRMVLRGEDVARRPADIRAQFDQRFDQNGGLDRHVKGAHDPRTGQRFFRAIFLAQRHQARHFRFGDVEFLTPELGEGDVFDDVVGHEVCPCRCSIALPGT
jgi:hypothetical protein